MAHSQRRAIADANAHAPLPSQARKEVLLLKRIFDEFDRDRDGRVSQSELASALKRFRDQTRPRGQSYKSPAEQSAEGIALLAFQVMDSDQDGAVSFDELLRLCLPEASEQDVQRCLALVAPRKSNGPPEVPEVAGAEISALFGIYDTDRSNSICVAELEAAGACGLDQRELQNLVEEHDVDGDGELNLCEFHDLMVSTGVFQAEPKGLFEYERDRERERAELHNKRQIFFKQP